MLAFKSLTLQELLKEVAEYLRLRALQVGLPAHPTFKKANKARREYARAQDDALNLVARELGSAIIVPATSVLCSSSVIDTATHGPLVHPANGG